MDEVLDVSILLGGACDSVYANSQRCQGWCWQAIKDTPSLLDILVVPLGGWLNGTSNLDGYISRGQGPGTTSDRLGDLCSATNQTDAGEQNHSFDSYQLRISAYSLYTLVTTLKEAENEHPKLLEIKK